MGFAGLWPQVSPCGPTFARVAVTGGGGVGRRDVAMWPAAGLLSRRTGVESFEGLDPVGLGLFACAYQAALRARGCAVACPFMELRFNIPCVSQH